MDCGHTGGLPKNFLQPCLLLLLRERPGYGYDLVTRLKELGVEEESASVYRALRSLEDDRAVVSYWNTSSSGPARRMYRLTPTGNRRLEEAVPVFHDTRRAIERYLCRYASIAGGDSSQIGARGQSRATPSGGATVDGGNGHGTASRRWGVFPARPGELVAYARSNQVPDSVIERLEGLPDRLYESVTEVLAALGEPFPPNANGGCHVVEPPAPGMSTGKEE